MLNRLGFIKWFNAKTSTKGKMIAENSDKYQHYILPSLQKAAASEELATDGMIYPSKG